MKSRSEIGDDFARDVATYFSLHADYVDINRRIRGKSGVIHEIDIYVIKKVFFGVTETAVECKYKNNGDRVTQEEMANFIVKLLDTGIKNGYFVTNFYFTNSARLLGKYCGIGLIEEFKEETQKDRYGREVHSHTLGSERGDRL